MLYLCWHKRDFSGEKQILLLLKVFLLKLEEINSFLISLFFMPFLEIRHMIALFFQNSPFFWEQSPVYFCSIVFVAVVSCPCSYAWCFSSVFSSVFTAPPCWCVCSGFSSGPATCAPLALWIAGVHSYPPARTSPRPLWGVSGLCLVRTAVCRVPLVGRSPRVPGLRATWAAFPPLRFFWGVLSCVCTLFLSPGPHFSSLTSFPSLNVAVPQGWLLGSLSPLPFILAEKSPLSQGSPLPCCAAASPARPPLVPHTGLGVKLCPASQTSRSPVQSLPACPQHRCRPTSPRSRDWNDHSQAKPSPRPVPVDSWQGHSRAAGFCVLQLFSRCSGRGRRFVQCEACISGVYCWPFRGGLPFLFSSVLVFSH